MFNKGKGANILEAFETSIDIHSSPKNISYVSDKIKKVPNCEQKHTSTLMSDKEKYYFSGIKNNVREKYQYKCNEQPTLKKLQNRCKDGEYIDDNNYDSSLVKFIDKPIDTSICLDQPSFKCAYGEVLNDSHLRDLHKTQKNSVIRQHQACIVDPKFKRLFEIATNLNTPEAVMEITQEDINNMMDSKYESFQFVV
jgi:hypothetical protein